MKGGCDGTLAEDEEHRRKSGRGCESKVERYTKMSHRKKREGNKEIFYYRYSEFLDKSCADADHIPA